MYIIICSCSDLMCGSLGLNCSVYYFMCGFNAGVLLLSAFEMGLMLLLMVMVVVVVVF